MGGITIQDGTYWRGALSKLRLLGMGYLYAIDSAPFSLAAAANRTLLVENNSLLGVLIQELVVFIPESKGAHTVELFSGGSFTGGTVIPQIPQKSFGVKAAPFQNALDDVTITVPGAPLGLFAGSFARIGGYLYTDKDHQSYITVTNVGAQTSDDLQISMIAASIEL